MPKSTGPLSEQLGFTSTQAPSHPDAHPNTNMTDKTTGMADNMGAKKATNAIPQEVRRHTSSSVVLLHLRYHEFMLM